MLEHTLLVCNTTDDEVHQDIEQPPGDGVRQPMEPNQTRGHIWPTKPSRPTEFPANKMPNTKESCSGNGARENDAEAVSLSVSCGSFEFFFRFRNPKSSTNSRVLAVVPREWNAGREIGEELRGMIR